MGFWDAFNFAAFMAMMDENEEESEEYGLEDWETLELIEEQTEEEELFELNDNVPIKIIEGGESMATIIGAGKYIFGEDIPLGRYTLKVVRGSGTLTFERSNDPKDEYWIDLGLEDYEAKSYNGLSLEQGMYFTLSGSLEVEITKSKMIEIE